MVTLTAEIGFRFLNLLFERNDAEVLGIRVNSARIVLTLMDSAVSICCDVLLVGGCGELCLFGSTSIFLGGIVGGDGECDFRASECSA